MIAAHRTQIDHVSLDLSRQQLDPPLHLSSGAITDLTLARVTVEVTVDGRRGRGVGVIYLSDLWAWPDLRLPHAEREGAMGACCEAIAARLAALCGGEAAHPLELGLRLHEAVLESDATVARPDMPALARAVCASPFDAALHDATGQALGLSAFALYDAAVDLPGAAHWLGSDPAGAIRACLLRPPLKELPGWYVVADPATDPNLETWVKTRGFTRFKIKTTGTVATDVARTVTTCERAHALGVASPLITADANQGYADAATVLAYLEALQATSPAAYAALLYLEQPTAADIVTAPQDWRAVAARKPVFLDEGLSTLERMPVAAAQGWSGFALKTCKGHSVLLLAAAWARQHGLALTLQDLTNPAEALIQSALTAAHLPTLNGVELNAPQFTPRANDPWRARLPTLFEPRNGSHRIAAATLRGLGSQA